MRILHIIPGLTWERGGPSAVVEALARHQAAAGHQVAVLSTDQGERHGERAIELPAGVLVERHRVRGPDRLSYAPGFARASRGLVRSHDVVHVHSIFTYPVHAALREALAAGVPAVLRPCGLLHRYSLRRSRWRKAAYLALWGRMVRRACSAWHFTSADEADESWPWDASRRFVLANGIEPSEYAIARDQAREELGRQVPELGDRPYVLFLGRLHPKKRLDLLLEAFLAGAPGEFKIVVAGPDEASLWDKVARRWLDEPKAKGRVVRLGMVTGRDKVRLLAGASLFALPSEHENFGIAALESLAAGTPVLLSPHVDLAEAVVAGGVGYTAPLAAADWQARLATLLADREPLYRAGAAARCWAAENYAWEGIAGRLVQQYGELQGGGAVTRCDKRTQWQGDKAFFQGTNLHSERNSARPDRK
jgi:glycosyltransferase involved in cell wall biosynthesis